MKKLLKIRFVKFERALVVQQLEIKGHFEVSENIAFTQHDMSLFSETVWISLGDAKVQNEICAKDFDSNTARDEYLENVIKWISEQQFATEEKLEIGKECEVSDYPDLENCRWEKRKLLAILPAQMKYRYITESDDNPRDFWCWTYARPIDSAQPKIEGDVYTWEMEVADGQ